MAGIALPIDSNKSVNIPIATAQAPGLVKGTDLKNGISVAENGEMSVNSIDVNKLIQTDEEQLILDGGNSSVD